MLTLWKEREPTYVRRRRNALREHDGVVPAFASGVIEGDGGAAGDGAAERKGKRRGAPRPKQPVGGPAQPAAPAPVTPEAASAPARTAADDEAQARDDAKARRARNRARKKHGRR